MENKRVPTGIKDLDLITHGGLPGKTSTLVQGPPGSGKTILCLQFINQGLKNKEPCIMLSTSADPKKVKQLMNSFGWKVSNPDLFFIIDLYSWRLGIDKGDDVITPHELNELNVVVSKAINKMAKDGRNIRVVIDSTSELLLHEKTESVIRFLESLTGRVNKEGGSVLLSVEKGAHDERIISILNYVTENTIDMEFDEAKRYLSIPRMQDSNFIPKQEIIITKKGIEFKEGIR